MRQFETPSSAAWVGNPQGGVSAPDPILLPDAATRFKRTAARLADLANDHPMSDWLLFLCNLSQAQHEAAQAIEPPPPDAGAVAKASSAGMPPLAADGHRRGPAWRDALRRLLERFDGAEGVPEALAAVVADLESRPEADLEALYRGALADLIPTGNRAVDEAAFPCNCARGNCAISARGDVFPCVSVPWAAGNVRQQAFGDIWRGSPVFQRIRGLKIADYPACAPCPDKAFCSRDRGAAYNASGSYTGTICAASRSAMLTR